MKKEIFIETFSIYELERKGFKQRQNGCGYYLGNAKSPTATIIGDITNLLGKKFILLNPDANGKIFIRNPKTDETHYIKEFLVKTKIPKFKIKKLIIDDDIASFNGYSFNVPYSCRNMPKTEAIKLAKWILKEAQK